MRIAITGGTGFLGSSIMAQARSRGDRFLLLTRHPGRPAPADTETVAWSDSAPAALPPHDAVFHLAGESVGQRWTDRVKQEIMESRRAGTRRLVDAIGAMKPEDRPKTLVSASAVGYYGERGEELLTEESPPGNGFLSEVCKVWEAEARRAEDLGARVVSVRIGVVLGKEGGALAKLLPPFKMGAGGPLGSGRQWFPWVHHRDVAGLFLFALDRDTLRGPVNAVAPGIVRGAEFAHTLGSVLHRPAIIPTPVALLRVMLGEFANSMVESQHVIPRAAADAGYTFQRPDLRGALKEILAETVSPSSPPVSPSRS
ncbi:MAG TPA: TIGR01777 family oxidoreductase [Armatimonadota bacterium]|nr:TIGR01777 family oxidoreductase [Armatimonadota bacterium]